MTKSFNDKHKTISSSLTFFYKYIFTTVWIAGFGYGTLSTYRSHDEAFLVFLAMWLLGSFFIYWGCARLKNVEIDKRSVYISNFFKMIQISLEDIDYLSENRFVNIHPIWITFKRPRKFGRRIMFMPQSSFRTMFFMSHPVVEEILLMVKNAKERTELGE